MRRSIHHSIHLCCLALVALSVAMQAQGGIAVPYSYQGDLTVAGIPANGQYDFLVGTYDAANGGTLLETIGDFDVTVVDGIFNLEVVVSDFELEMPLWLEISVREAGSGSYTPLLPRQQLKGALTSYLSFNVPDNSIDSNAVMNNSLGAQDIDISEIQARVVGTCPSGSAMIAIGVGGTVGCTSVDENWSLTGNSNTNPGVNFIGNVDDEPLELRTNNATAMRFLWAPAPGGGSPGVAIVGGAITNSVTADSPHSVIAGGGNQFSGNSIDGASNVIGGGVNNDIDASGGVIGGGQNNSVAGNNATIPGGAFNVANGDHSFAAGRQSSALHPHTFVFNDGGGAFETTDAGQFLIDVSDGVGIGINDPTDLLHVSAPTGADAFRVQVDGTTRLRVHDNGGVSIGSNNFAEPGGLRVAGHARVIGQGLDVGGISGQNEVIARFQTENGGAAALSVDADSDRDAVVYLAENSNAKWSLRTDASDQGLASSIEGTVTVDESFEIRAEDNGVSKAFVRVQLGTNDSEMIGFPVDLVRTFGDLVTTRVFPEDNGAQNLGLVNRRWFSVFLATQPNVSSDRRLKHAISPVRYGLDAVLQLRPVSYRLNQDPEERDHMGLIAQDVYRVIPQITSGAPEDDQMMSMRYPELIPVLIRAIQEQQEQIDRQEQEIQSLKRLMAGQYTVQAGR